MTANTSGWLDSCGDDEVVPDSAVKMMESVTWVLGNLPDYQRERVIETIGQMAAAEADPGRRWQLPAFSFCCGLVDDESESP